MPSTSTINDYVTKLLHWATSGTKLTYAAVGVGLVVGLILFKAFFKSLAGFFHCIGFSVGSGGNPAVAAQPGLSSSSRLKLLLVMLVPAACCYAAYMLLPRWFPAVFH
jgi:hypothetical protein